MATRMSRYRGVAPAHVDQRVADRHPVELKRATVRRHGAKSADARLCDISAYGCRVQSDLDVGIGERLWLRFPDSLPVAATVIWRETGLTGCRFDAPIETAMVRKLALPSY